MSSHQIVTVNATEATKWSLSGHEAICSCGYRMSTSLSAYEAQVLGRLHIECMEAKAQRIAKAEAKAQRAERLAQAKVEATVAMWVQAGS